MKSDPQASLMLFVEALEDTGGVFDAVGAVGDGDSVAIGIDCDKPLGLVVFARIAEEVVEDACEGVFVTDDACVVESDTPLKVVIHRSKKGDLLLNDLLGIKLPLLIGELFEVVVEVVVEHGDGLGATGDTLDLLTLSIHHLEFEEDGGEGGVEVVDDIFDKDLKELERLS